MQEIVSNAVKAKRQEELKLSRQLSLGELIAKLEAIENKELQVHFVFENAVPTDFASWRGSYDELAICFSFDRAAPTVGQFLKMCRDTVGSTFEGY